MNYLRAIMAVAVLGCTFGLVACDEADGPAEQAGQAVDEAVQDTKRAVEDASD